MSEEPKKSLYEMILEKGRETFKSINDKIARQRDKRAFKSAFDNALEKRDKARSDRMKLYEKLGEYNDNMEKIIKTLSEERQADITMTFLKEQYLEVFGREMPEGED